MLSTLTYLNISSVFFFFFNDTATTEIYTLSLHDALPIPGCNQSISNITMSILSADCITSWRARRSEEHTSELQSQFHLVCRLLLEKKKKHITCIYLQIKKKK